MKFYGAELVPWAPIVMIVEGESDNIMLRNIVEGFQGNIEGVLEKAAIDPKSKVAGTEFTVLDGFKHLLQRMRVIKANGKGHIRHIIRMLEKLDVPYFCVVDGDAIIGGNRHMGAGIKASEMYKLVVQGEDEERLLEGVTKSWLKEEMFKIFNIRNDIQCVQHMRQCYGVNIKEESSLVVSQDEAKGLKRNMKKDASDTDSRIIQFLDKVKNHNLQEKMKEASNKKTLIMEYITGRQSEDTDITPQKIFKQHAEQIEAFFRIFCWKACPKGDEKYSFDIESVLRSCGVELSAKGDLFKYSEAELQSLQKQVLNKMDACQDIIDFVRFLVHRITPYFLNFHTGRRYSSNVIQNADIQITKDGGVKMKLTFQDPEKYLSPGAGTESDAPSNVVPMDAGTDADNNTSSKQHTTTGMDDDSPSPYRGPADSGAGDDAIPPQAVGNNQVSAEKAPTKDEDSPSPSGTLDDVADDGEVHFNTLERV